MLNADDPRLVARARNFDGSIVWFSPDAQNPVLAAHRAAGGTGCTLNRGRIVLCEGDTSTPVVQVKRIPLCFGGVARHNVANALGAAALAHELGIEPKAIADGLCALRNEDNPGRSNLYEVGGVHVLLDFAHNPHGLRAMAALAGEMPAQRRALIIGQAGDRSDDDIRELAWAAHDLRFDRVFIKRLDKYSRGRPEGEAAAMLREEFLAQGYRAAQVRKSQTELGALRATLRWAEPGDQIICLAHEDREGLMSWLAGQQSAHSSEKQEQQGQMQREHKGRKRKKSARSQ